ncbi:unnamed protein product [Mytilus coruscus]|uniref:Uncharacterized protein n=1 Tax=Mytilus coruscus TaxID=42192 RepID=A0A6J8D1Z5_MYTCO|nr:unnamed protein product [Mytilus coruscus]
MWKTENVDWDKLKVNIDNVFDEHWHEASNDINVLWDIWKAKVNYAADMVMKKVPFVNNYRNFWDKPLDRMLKSRRDANRLQRLHNRTRNHDSQLGTHISGVYKKRKLALHEAIKRKEFDRMVKCLTVKGIATNKNSKFFWKLLRGPKESVNPSRIIDPNNKDDFIEDDADINDRLCKRVFSKMVQLNESVWKYVQEMNTYTESIGSDKFKCQYGNAITESLIIDVTTKSSLELYQHCYIKTGSQLYLEDISDFNSSRLKLLARTNYLPLKQFLFRMHMSEDNLCPICDSGESEDLEHFLNGCTSLEQTRSKFFTLFASFNNRNVSFLELSPRAQVLFLVGDIGYAYAFNDEIGSFYDVYGRMYLLELFRLRHIMVEPK